MENATKENIPGSRKILLQTTKLLHLKQSMFHLITNGNFWPFEKGTKRLIALFKYPFHHGRPPAGDITNPRIARSRCYFSKKLLLRYIYISKKIEKNSSHFVQVHAANSIRKIIFQSIHLPCKPGKIPSFECQYIFTTISSMKNKKRGHHDV